MEDTDKKNWELWRNITFKTHAYRKNFDLINDNENIITEYDGEISEIRISERKPPRIIGEYGFSVWNIVLGEKFSVNFDKLIGEHAIENTYNELINIIRKKEINLKDYKKIVLIHTFILHKNYRKHGITEEFTEMLYRDFYCEGIAILVLVKPFQDNTIDADFYLNRKTLIINESFKPVTNNIVSATEYYSLNELMEKKDTEMNEYKLFAVANKCGFMRINDSYLFILSPEKIIKRMEKKQKVVQSLENK